MVSKDKFKEVVFDLVDENYNKEDLKEKINNVKKYNTELEKQLDQLKHENDMLEEYISSLDDND